MYKLQEALKVLTGMDAITLQPAAGAHGEFSGMLVIKKYFEPLFNFLITIPFCIYLRYYFKCSFLKTLIYSFLLSLFFELSQLSGLYFMYPRPYRLCDVNDLINNTTGGILGFLIEPLFSMFLPDRDKIDDKSYSRGRTVSVLRKGVALTIDYFIISFISVAFIILFHIPNIEFIYIALSLFTFAFIPYFSHGYTLGKLLLKYKLISNDMDGSIPFYKYFIKWIILHFVIFDGWFILGFICQFFNIEYVYALIVYLVLFGLFLLYCLFCLIINRDIFINRILGIFSESVIGIDDEV